MKRKKRENDGQTSERGVGEQGGKVRQRSRKEKNHPSHRSEGRRGKSQWKSETETAFYATFGTPKYSKSERRRELALKEELKKKKTTMENAERERA